MKRVLGALFILLSLTSATPQTIDGKVERHLGDSGDKYALFEPSKFEHLDFSVLAALTHVAKYGWNIFFVFGAIPQYYPQFNELLAGKGQAFSPLICWILLTANIIRIFYWFGEPFDMVLLLQSFVMVFVQLALLYALTNTRKNVQKLRTIFTGPVKDFWDWDDFQSYFTYAIALAAALSAACSVFLSSRLFVDVLGYGGLLIEATLALPQLLKNSRNGTEGLSPFLFWTWLIGDIAKTVSFIALAAPIPFVLCGVFQILTDVAILLQIFMGSKKPMKAKNSHIPLQEEQ